MCYFISISMPSCSGAGSLDAGSGAGFSAASDGGPGGVVFSGSSGVGSLDAGSGAGSSAALDCGPGGVVFKRFAVAET